MTAATIALSRIEIVVTAYIMQRQLSQIGAAVQPWGKIAVLALALLGASVACSSTSPATLDGGQQDTTRVAPDQGASNADVTVDARLAPDGNRALRSWQEIPNAAPQALARSVHRLVYDGQRILAVAGQPPGQALPTGDLWQWDGSTWTELTPAKNVLPKRKNHGIAHDTVRGRVVVFGGIVGGLGGTPKYLNDTWEWDGKDWVERPTSGDMPAGRAGHGMTYDVARGTAVIFGGASAFAVFNDTWVLKDGVWSKMEPATSPPARLNCQLVYDATRGVTVLFGGTTPDGPLSDTWEWDGQNWTDRTPTGGASPPARGFYAMVYDAARQRTVLSGGTTTWPPFIGPDNMFGDHWEWDGNSWTELDPPAYGLRSGHSAAFDLQRNRIVVLGGFRAVGAQTGVDDDTWEYVEKN